LAQAVAAQQLSPIQSPDAPLLCEISGLEQGIAEIEKGIIARQSIGAEINRLFDLALLAEAHTISGQIEQGLNALNEGFALATKTGEGFYEPELYRLKGEILLKKTGTAAEAAAYYQQAFDLARRQGAKSLELRAGTSLARLWRDQGKRAEAYDLLAPLHAWFTEGLDTADLISAKVLLRELDMVAH
jgi:predicted ATPase